MSAPIEAAAYHAGLVVHAVDAAIARYERLFGATFAIFEYDKSASRLAEAPAPATRLRVAYGRVAGMTFELIQPLDGNGTHAEFLEKRGEGVHHFGFWVPDLQRAVEGALEHGARLTSASITAAGSAVVSIAGMAPHDVARVVGPPVAFVDMGDGPEIELVGAAAIGALETLLGDRLADIIDPPPWPTAGG